jgi:hypothetical protein
VKEEVARYREALGVDHFIMRLQWPGLPQERVLGSIERLGRILASTTYAVLCSTRHFSLVEFGVAISTLHSCHESRRLPAFMRGAGA